MKNLFQPQCCETRQQLQEKPVKKHKYVEIKQYVFKQQTGYLRNQKGNKKISRNKLQ